MRAIIATISVGLGLALAGGALAEPGKLSGHDQEIYRAAFRDAEAARWSQANEVAGEAHDRLLGKVLEWLYLARPASGASFDEIAAFIKANPDWPWQNTLHERAEEAIPDDLPPTAVRAWFEANPPTSATGKIRFAEALLATGEEQRGTELLRKTWIEDNLGERQEQILMFKHHDLIRAADNDARLDRLLWSGQTSAAREMLRRVDKAHALLGEARLTLQAMAAGVEGALRRVPQALRDTPGLVFDRLRWRMRKDHDDEAREILMHPPADLVRPDLWWRERVIEIRRAFAQGYYSEAQRMAEHHGQEVGTPGYAEGEWIAGWIALRVLKDPASALGHFERMANSVQYPVSRARAEYWRARALEAMGKRQEAEAAFAEAARNGLTYYGQLAALQLNPEARPALPAPPDPTPAEREAFNAREQVHIVRELAQIGEDDTAEAFIKRLATLAKSAQEAQLVASLAIEEQRPDLAVRLARHTWHGEMPLTAASYPLLPLPDSTPTERALVLSVIRQESAFDPHAVSQAGARGLMQVMPTTARQTVGKVRLGPLAAKLTEDPPYNIRVGSTILANNLDDFSGNYVLALAAYNAGAARVREWIREYGDPRSPQTNVIDWIEMIPFDETRNYVQRVLESLHVYRERLAGTRLTLELQRDLGEAKN